jgi:hypothetical protein
LTSTQKDEDNNNDNNQKKQPVPKEEILLQSSTILPSIAFTQSSFGRFLVIQGRTPTSWENEAIKPKDHWGHYRKVLSGGLGVVAE